MLSTIATGNVDWADIFFLIGVVLFAVAAVVAVVRKVPETALVPAGLAFTALALLVL